MTDGRAAAAEPPEEDLDAITVGPPAAAAAGLTGVVVSLRYAGREMGAGRAARTLGRVNQHGGFDCQSCAWPDPEGSRHVAEFCENGAKAVAWEATTRRATPELFAERTLAELGALSDQALGDLGRLTQPMVLRPGAERYAPIAWDDAFALVAAELNALDSPDEAAFYTSGRTSNEAAFLWQLFARQYGTNNLPDCSNLCHESSGVALGEAIGVGKGTVSLGDFDLADAIIIVGQNPGTNHPRMLSTLERAKRRGATIVSVNPMVEPGIVRFKHPQDARDMLGRGTALADVHLRVRVNGDVAVLQGIAKALLACEDARPGTVLDHAFIAEHTAGFEAYAAAVRALSWTDVEAAGGVARAELEQVADVLAGAGRVITCWGMGLTQHANAVANIQEVANLHLLRGQIGRPGAGLCPVRGHSNVQGDRTVGVTNAPRPAFLEALGRECAFAPPSAAGCDTVEAIRRMRDGRMKVLVAMGGNFLQATPDTAVTAAALRRCRLTVHVATKPNRAHLVAGRTALLLPVLGRSERDVQAAGEQFVTTENSMSVVQASRGPNAPASPWLLSEPALVARLARAVLGTRTSVDWEAMAGDYRLIRAAIARVVPGFERYDARAQEPGGFRLPNAAAERRFVTATGKANFTVHPLPRLALAPGELLLTTVRSHDQFNTTVYAPNDRYRGVRGGRRVLFMHPDDVADRGLTGGVAVDVVNDEGGVTRRVRRFRVVPYDIPRGCVAAYFPEANALVPLDRVADRSGTPTSKSVPVTVTRSA